MTATSSEVTTTTLTTKYICFTLSPDADGLTPSTTCRRRRDAYWYHANIEPLLYVVYGDDGEQHNIHPSPIIRFQSTALPEFRIHSGPSSSKKESAAEPMILKQTHQLLQPSFEKTPDDNRIAQPIFFGGLNSIISSVVLNIVISFYFIPI